MKKIFGVALTVMAFASFAQAEKVEYLVKVDQLKFRPTLSFSSQLEKVRDDVFVVKLSKEEAKFVKKSQGILHLSKNIELHLFNRPNDLKSKLWGLKNREKRGVSIDINALSAWSVTTGSKDVIISVIDTGADVSHPDLKDNLWVNVAEKEGEAGVDDDGNGIVDDIHGYDFTNQTGELKDTVGHGTHVAGTIGATGDNDKGIVGVNWTTQLMIVNVFPARGGAKLSDLIKAIDYSVANGAKVINASWGGPGPAESDPEEEKAEFLLLKESIQRASDAGVTFVAASGNSRLNMDKKTSYPASFDVDNIISVGSITKSGRRSSFSNYGQTGVDVMAPGSSILSLRPGGRTTTLSGTSMAAPHVAGVVGLMLSHNKDLDPVQIKDTLNSTCVKTNRLKSSSVCGGYIDAHAAVIANPPVEEEESETPSEEENPSEEAPSEGEAQS